MKAALIAWGSEQADRIEHVARRAEAFAADVDREGRFPSEAVAAMREGGLLGCALGGPDQPRWSLAELAEAARILAASCSSTGMVWAMHHGQALMVRNHATSARWDEVRTRLANDELLLASAVSEGSGDLLRSEAFLTWDDDWVEVEKAASTVSYGCEADALLVSARRSSDAGPSDLALALVLTEHAERTPTGSWDAMGMRGTVSQSMRVSARFPAAHVFDEPFEAVHRLTAVPANHVLWSGCWLGIAESALSEARKRLRKSHATTGSALVDFSSAVGELDVVRAMIAEGVARIGAFGEADLQTPATESSATWFNGLKVTTSSIATRTVLTALRVMGVPGYLEDGPSSIARKVRDILSAELMVGNYRIKDANGPMDIVRWRG